MASSSTGISFSEPFTINPGERAVYTHNFNKFPLQLELLDSDDRVQVPYDLVSVKVEDENEVWALNEDVKSWRCVFKITWEIFSPGLGTTIPASSIVIT